MKAQYATGSFAGGSRDDNGTLGGCTVDWDHERGQWCARLVPHEGDPGWTAWSDSSHAAALAVFAMWLGVTQELAVALIKQGSGR